MSLAYSFGGGGGGQYILSVNSNRWICSSGTDRFRVALPHGIKILLKSPHHTHLQRPNERPRVYFVTFFCRLYRPSRPKTLIAYTDSSFTHPLSHYIEIESDGCSQPIGLPSTQTLHTSAILYAELCKRRLSVCVFVCKIRECAKFKLYRIINQNEFGPTNQLFCVEWLMIIKEQNNTVWVISMCLLKYYKNNNWKPDWKT